MYTQVKIHAGVKVGGLRHVSLKALVGSSFVRE
jgi:hypothetical protein